MFSPFLCGKADVVDSSTKMTTIASSNGISGRSRSVDDVVEDGGSSSVVGGTSNDSSPLSKTKKFFSPVRMKSFSDLFKSDRRTTNTPSLLTPSKSFGVPLDQLCHASPDGIPNLVVKVTQFVEENALDVEGIYRVNPNQRVLDELKAEFDKAGDADLKGADIASVGALLKRFFRELPGPLITKDVMNEIAMLDDVGHPVDREFLITLSHLLPRLPPCNYRVLKYLVRHLHIVSRHEDKNKMSSANLAIVFGPNIVSFGGTLEYLHQQNKTMPVLRTMIHYYKDVFPPDHGANGHAHIYPPPPSPYKKGGQGSHYEEVGGTNKPLQSTVTHPPDTPSGIYEEVDFITKDPALQDEVFEEQETVKPNKEMSTNVSGRSPRRSSGERSAHSSTSSVGDGSEEPGSLSRPRPLSPLRWTADNGALYTTVARVPPLTSSEGYQEVNMDRAVIARKKLTDHTRSPTASLNLKHTPSPAPSPISMSSPSPTHSPAVSPRSSLLLDSAITSTVKNLWKDPLKLRHIPPPTTHHEASGDLVAMETNHGAELSDARKRRQRSKNKHHDDPSVTPTDTPTNLTDSNVGRQPEVTDTPTDTPTDLAPVQRRSKSRHANLQHRTSGACYDDVDVMATEESRVSAAKGVVHKRRGQKPVRHLDFFEKSGLVMGMGVVGPQVGFESEDHPNVVAVGNRKDDGGTIAVGTQKEIVDLVDTSDPVTQYILRTEDPDGPVDSTVTAFDGLTVAPPLVHLTKSRPRGPPGRHKPLRRSKVRRKPRVAPTSVVDGPSGGKGSSKAQTIPEEVDGYSEEKMVESIPEKKMAEIVPEKKMAESLSVVKVAESVREKTMADPVAVTKESDVLHPVSAVETISTLPGGVDMSDVRREEGVAQPPEEHLLHVLEKILRNLREKRRKVNRPESLAEMTWNELKDEKRAVQGLIIQFEKQYGRPKSKHGKDTMKPVYTRYRDVKGVIAGGQAAHEAGLKRATPSDHTLEYTLPNITLSQSLPPMNSEEAIVGPMSESLSLLSQTTPTGWEQYPSASNIDDLVKQQDELLMEKKVLRKKLQEFERSFQQRHGRLAEKEDKKDFSTEYSRYKQIKCLLRTLSERMSASQSSV